jgi:hypothetical protein
MSAGEVPRIATTPPGEATYEPGDLLYALGVLDYDFGGEARRDFLTQYMRPASPFVRSELLAYLGEHPTEIEWLTWTVNSDGTPICALQPSPAFARDVYGWLRRSLAVLHADTADLFVSIPGVIVGRKRLTSGQIVPAIDPALVGMYSWEQLGRLRQYLKDGVVYATEQGQILTHIQNFQRRVYRELRNHGRTSQERAMNFAITMAFRLTHQLAFDYAQTRIESNRQAAAGAMELGTHRQLAALTEALTERTPLELNQVEVTASPICRPDSAGACWDVKLILFDPNEGLKQAKTVYRCMVDVSAVVPVVIGLMDRWQTI